MGYSITTSSPYPSNKPSYPDLDAYETSFPHLREYPTGIAFRISHPKPDKIHLSIPLLDEVLTETLASQAPLTSRCEAVSQILCSGYANACIVPKSCKAAYGKPYNRKFQLEVGISGALLRCELLNSSKDWPRLCLQFNPTKYGIKGHAEVATLLFGSDGSSAPPIFRQDRFAHFAKLTQLDFAVDCIGVKPSEVIAIRQEVDGKTVYSASNGLETLYIRNSSNPHTKALLKVYDKTTEMGKKEDCSPPSASITRVEVTRKGLKNKYLADIYDLADAFKKVRCGYAYSQGAKAWHRLQTFRSLRLSHDLQNAAEILRISSAESAALEKIITTVPKPDIIRPKLTWDNWNEGCSATGINAILPV